MNYTYPQFVKLYFQITGSWADVSGYAASTFDGEQSIGNNPMDMLAYAGSLRFELNNWDNTFSPDHENCLTGFGEGTPAKLTIGYESVENDIFVGRVGKLTFDNEIGSPQRAYVTLYDWLEDAVHHKLENLSVATNKRGDEGIALAIADMDVQPTATDLQEGDNTFDTFFDVSTSETTTYAEMQRATASELGYCYLQKDGTLVFEAASYRNGLRELSKIPSGYEDLHPILSYPDEVIILTESGTPILLDTLTDADFDNTMESLDLEYGSGLVNYLTMWQYPRKVDASPVVLFTLNEPIRLVSGQEVEIKGYYSDPVSGNAVNGQNMSYPSGTRDYLVFANANGTGANLTTSLQFISVEYGSEGFTHKVKNTNAASGWLTKYKPQGYGVYTFDATQKTSKSLQSIEDRGMRTETLQQRYQRTGDQAQVWGDAFVDYHKTPRTEVKGANFCANISPLMMRMFLHLEIGDLIRLRQTQRNVDGLFYIQGIKYSISIGGVIVFKWILKAAFTLALGLSPIAVEFRGTSYNDGVDFGALSQVNGLEKMTIVSQIYIDSNIISTAPTVVGSFSDASGYEIVTNSTSGDPRILYSRKYSTGLWQWYSSERMSLGEWHRIVVIHDTSVNDNNTPQMFIDGVEATINVLASASNQLNDETGNHLIIGNVNTVTIPWTRQFDGKVKNVRIYNRVLSASEVLADYNGTDITDGLVFRASSVRTKELSAYIDQSLNDELKLIDDIRGAVGTPHDAPIGRNP